MKNCKNLIALTAFTLMVTSFGLFAQQPNRVKAPGNPPAAHVDYFLKIDGIEGESTDNKHKDWIEIESWSWGESNSAINEIPPVPSTSGTGGGGGAGKVSMQDFHFTMKANKATPKLMQFAASGQHIKEAKLSCRKTGGSQQEYYVVKFEDLLVSSYQSGGSTAGSDRPMESLSLNFTKITFSTIDKRGNERVVFTGGK